MGLELTNRVEFSPNTLRKVLPDYHEFHDMSVAELASELGWPIRKTKAFFGAEGPTYPEDILHVSLALNVHIVKLISGLASYRTPDWHVKENEYLAELKQAKAMKHKDPKEYRKSITNIIKKRYKLSVIVHD